MNGYNTRPRIGGGTGFIFTESMTQHVTQLRWDSQNNERTTWIMLKPRCRNDRKLILASVYLPPVSQAYPIDQYTEDLSALETDSRYWSDRGHNVVVCRYFNARIGRSETDPRVPCHNEETTNCYNPESAGSQAPGPDVCTRRRRSDIPVGVGQYVLTVVSRHYVAGEH